jgi:hypothetical protein
MGHAVRNHIPVVGDDFEAELLAVLVFVLGLELDSLDRALAQGDRSGRRGMLRALEVVQEPVLEDEPPGAPGRRDRNLALLLEIALHLGVVRDVLSPRLALLRYVGMRQQGEKRCDSAGVQHRGKRRRRKKETTNLVRCDDDAADLVDVILHHLLEHVQGLFLH